MKQITVKEIQDLFDAMTSEHAQMLADAINARWAGTRSVMITVGPYNIPFRPIVQFIKYCANSKGIDTLDKLVASKVFGWWPDRTCANQLCNIVYDLYTIDYEYPL